MKRLAVALAVVLFAVPALGLSVSSEPVGYQDWYGQLSARSGLLWNATDSKWDGYATVPVLGYKALSLELGLAMDPANDDGPKAAVLGLTYDVGSLADFGVEVSWAKYVSFRVGPYVEYDFESDEFAWGAMSSMLEFSFDQGNVDRQKADK
jgi:hypothetical protein